MRTCGTEIAPAAAAVVAARYVMQAVWPLSSGDVPDRFCAVLAGSVAGKGDDAGEERPRDARAANACPTAVDADIHGNSGRAAGLGRYVGVGAAGAARIVLPRRLRDGGADLSRVGAPGTRIIPNTLGKSGTAYFQLRSPDRDHAVECRGRADVVVRRHRQSRRDM